tara:strand:- start:10 stop:330 length:321 start_codon:yes stop_codon:yes gene_type:complete
MTTTGVILCLILSSIICLLIWYIKNLLTKLLFISENIGDLSIKVIELTEHIDTVYSMETFYGDLTLQNLLKHCRTMTDELRTFERIYSLTTEIDEGIETDDNYEGE